MKRLSVVLVVACLAFASNTISFNRIENLAQKIIHQKFGYDYHVDEVITYYGINDQPGAYAFVFRSTENKPLTIVMGARYTTSPLNEIDQALPRSKVAFDKVLQKARTLGNAEPEFQRVYYFGPGREYCGFKIGDKEYLINACTFNVLEKSLFFENRPEPHAELERMTREKWDRYFNTPSFAARDSAYIPGVPFIQWTYGCSPTAASMIFGYWDPRGYGRLWDYFYTHWDYIEDHWDDCANNNKELAIRMFTDTLVNGGTSINNIRNGMINCANSDNGYTCSGALSPMGWYGNDWLFDWFEREIDAGRPCHWNVFWYWQGGRFINHSVTGIGYSFSPAETLCQIHTTWSESEPFWPLWTYHEGRWSNTYTVTFIPGGAVDDNMFLTSPLGGFVFKDLKYRIKWDTLGTDISRVKLWYSIGRNAQGYDSLRWTLIEGNAPNTCEYIWTAPNQDSALRVNIAGYNGSNQRLGADGTYKTLQCLFPGFSSNLNLVGHFNDAQNALDIKRRGWNLYIANGTDGLYVVDFSDSSLPEEVAHLDLPGNNAALDIISTNLFIADQEDTLRVVSIVDPSNPNQIATLYLSGIDRPVNIFTAGNYAYIACRGTGIEIVDVSSPSSPAKVGSYNTPGQAYDVYVAGTIAYVADGTRGILVLDVSDPANPDSIGSYDTDGTTQGLDLDGNYLYLAEGGRGIKIFDVSDPTDPQPVGSLDTDGTAKKVFNTDSLYVCDAGNGLLVIDVSSPSTPVQVGYMENFGTATSLVHHKTMLYLADNADGVYLIHEDLPPGVKEHTQETAIRNLTISSPQTGAIKFNLYLDNKNDFSIKIYDVTGRLYNTTHKKNNSSGEYEFTWRPLAAGIYFVRVETDHGIVARKVVFLK